MTETTTRRARLDAALETRLENISSETRHSTDAWGNRFLWCDCSSAAPLTQAAELLASAGARLCTVTAMVRELYTNPVTFLAYHFDVHGVTVTVTVRLDPVDNTVDSITPYFANADWNEREFAELYDIRVRGNANPKRLFLDPDIEEGILNEVIPLTVMMNGACTKDMWERVMEKSQDVEPSTRHEGRGRVQA